MSGGLLFATTVIEKAGKLALAAPSDTVIVIFEWGPRFAAVGVPLSWPVEASKVTHEGLLPIENVSACPSGSEAAGRNEYAWPAATELAGVPEIVGARLDGPGALPLVTAIAKTGKAVRATPSDTETSMPPCVPMSAAVGVPHNLPVAASNCAHTGFPVTRKASVWPSASDTCGMNS